MSARRTILPLALVAAAAVGPLAARGVAHAQPAPAEQPDAGDTTAEDGAAAAASEAAENAENAETAPAPGPDDLEPMPDRAPPPPRGAAQPPAEDDGPPPIEAEVQGTCRTPRQAWLQLLWWLQRGTRWDPRRAAICFDTSRLRDPAVQGPRRAEMLKRTLDGAQARIDVDALPTDPGYRDDDGRHRFVAQASQREFGDRIELVRRGGKWLFSAATVEQIPALYPALTGWVQELLPGWAKSELLGVELWKYLAVLLLFVLASLVRRLVVLLIGVYVGRLVRRTGLSHVESALERSHGPIGGLAMAGVFGLVFPMLLFPLRIAEIVSFAVEALTAFSFVWLAYRLIDVVTGYLLERAEKTLSKLDDQLVPLVSKTLKVFVSVVGFIFILQNLDVEIGSLLAGLGIGGLAFALAAKDTIANFFGSLMIFIDKPFQIGDWVVMSGTEGVIEEVGFRTSRVRTFYNSLVTVPNQMVTNAIVDNYGARQFRRYSTELGLTYDTPPDKVEAFCEGLRAIIAGMPRMRKDYYLVEFKEFGASQLTILVYCFMIAETWNDELRTRTNLNLEIMRLAESLGVSFAFPTRTLHVETMANLGESRPSHSGPSGHEEFTEVIDGFGPNGRRARPRGIAFTTRYDCDADKKGGDSG